MLNTLTPRRFLAGTLAAALGLLLVSYAIQPAGPSFAADKTDKPDKPDKANKKQAKAKAKAEGENEDASYAKYAIYEKTAPRAKATQPVETGLPLKLNKGDRIAFIGNTLLEREQHFGFIESLLQQRYPQLELVFRNLSWPADTPDLQPRPANFADTEQHLVHENIDVIFAAYGFNESFDGPEGLPRFRAALSKHIAELRSKAFNGSTAPRIVLLSPIANENVKGVPAGDLNNERIRAYVEVIREVAAEQKVGFVDLYTATHEAMSDAGTDLTINGAHLNDEGYALVGRTAFRQLVNETPPAVNAKLREAVLDKDRQFFRRFRPANTFYYTGGRNQSYGYLDFLPAMRNFDVMTANRDQRIHALAQGKPVAEKIDDTNVPPMPVTKESRGANEWMSAADEYKAFKVDPRFEVNLFAGEEQFPDIADPIQMRWDSRGRLWVSCSTTYPHVYPGNEPNDKLVILEDTDGDGKADKSTVFADDLHIPLSFEFGDGGVYVSEMPHLTFLKDTDGDGKADVRRIVLTGFGTEDSHHSLHDIVWTPDGDLIWRDSIFLHSQVETPYGPVRQQNSGWFRFQPRDQKLISFGTYPSTNPWGVTFDHWGQHVASHPIYAAAFHSLDPPYPQQHRAPAGLRAYSGTCGQEFVDFKTFPAELQGGFIKVRYKPTNRVEIHKWSEKPFGYDEEYVGDLLFSSNLSFIPVDIGFGPRGALYVCDWYNPVKGHAQYSLRDERRDRRSGRIWRITTKGVPLQEAPKIAEAPIEDLLDLLKRPEYRYRYWAKRELRERDPQQVKAALDKWVAALSAAKDGAAFRHHQLEAVWTYRWIGVVNTDVLRELLSCDNHHARAAATQQLRYWHPHLSDTIALLRAAANDPSAIVRMEAAIAASYIGSKEALDAMLDIARHPRDGHLAYAFTSALESHTLRPHWEKNPAYASVPKLLKESKQAGELAEPKATAGEAQFDGQPDLKLVRMAVIPERMKYTVDQFTVKPGQPVKVVFSNPDATDHNLLFVVPDALEEVGVAANDMAKDPANANSDFIPASKKKLILHFAPMIGPTRSSLVYVLRFKAPSEPGLYPYVCTYPGHWVMMNGLMVVARDGKEAEKLLATRKQPVFVKEWKVEDLAKDADAVAANHKLRDATKGMQAFMKAQCHQCHAAAGHGVGVGPDLTKVAEKYKGAKLLQQILEPSSEINEQYRTYQFYMKDGDVQFGTIKREDAKTIELIPSLLAPGNIVKVPVADVERRVASKLSAMPQGMVNVLTKDEILDLLSFLETGGRGEAGEHGGH
ncbi:MAG: PVC-type heme-binding CxxCH protein [Phycisphaeraceae bacterium]